jgi:hypothetical protein
MSWKQKKALDEKITNLEFDRHYMNQIYDEQDHTILDYFYQKKPNHSFNGY